jgi:amidohydrolase
MIVEGCLEGVEEVYGFHNIPNFDEGDIRVIEGPIMASSSMVTIKINGKGGHGSQPHSVIDVLSAGAAIVTNLHAVKSRGVDSRENCIFSVTKFEGGHAFNVFPDTATILGTIRTYNSTTLETIKDKIKKIVFSTAEAFGCTIDFDVNDKYPPTINHKTEVEHVRRLAEANFGKVRVKTDGLPMTAAEDFSYYLQERPGCFYMLGTKKEGEDYILHTSHFDFNDEVIASGALMFVRIVEDRLGAKIL